MSRTKRKENEWESKNWRKTIDKKRGYKPAKWFKHMNRHSERAATKGTLRNAVANNKDFDNVIIPDPKRHDVWDWN